MSAQPFVSSYLHCVLDLPPLVAAAAYDDRAHNGDVASRWTVHVDDGRLEMRPPIERSSGANYSPYRTQPAWVIAGLRRWPATLELMPWSADRCELGLRPVGRVFERNPSEALLGAGTDALHRLAAELEAWAATPLRELRAS